MSLAESVVEAWAAADAGEAICRRDGAAGVIVLNRPQALNAVTLGMVRAISAALDAWRDDPAVTRVVIAGAGGKAFCAGGDIRRLHDLGRAGAVGEALTFWREEYRLNIAIKRFPKPFVALIDGIVMGGGVGLSLHGSHRVAGDRTLFAMPEVGIGFFPDVGATWALPRLPGQAGAWLALTGARVKAADALALGLATHTVPSAGLGGLMADLVAGRAVDAALAAAAVAPGDAPVTAHREDIDACFAGDEVTGILAALDARGTAFAAEAARAIRTKAPLSLCVALRQMRLGAGLDFEAAMALEYRIVSRMLDNPDFFEGVRAVVIDKDQTPRWRPASLAEVEARQVDRFFAPLLDAELAETTGLRP